MDYASSIRSVVPGTFVPDLGANDEKPDVSAIPGGGDASGVTSFKDTVKQMLADVNDKITTSDSNTRDLATGATNDLQKVVTSVEEANLALQYTMAIRSKLLTAYQSVASIQF
jgi:flagellar hook-basal body complex protein FliE